MFRDGRTPIVFTAFYRIYEAEKEVHVLAVMPDRTGGTGVFRVLNYLSYSFPVIYHPPSRIPACLLTPGW